MGGHGNWSRNLKACSIALLDFHALIIGSYRGDCRKQLQTLGSRILLAGVFDPRVIVLSVKIDCAFFELLGRQRWGACQPERLKVALFFQFRRLSKKIRSSQFCGAVGSCIE